MREQRERQEHQQVVHEPISFTEDDQRRKLRNRRSTLKQRRRQYRYEIIRRGIDPRFTITIVKEILRRYEVEYTAVNISKSTITGKTSLYIGIRNPSKLREFETRTRKLFTTDYYNEFRARHHLNRRGKKRQIHPR